MSRAKHKKNVAENPFFIFVMLGADCAGTNPSALGLVNLFGCDCTPTTSTIPCASTLNLLATGFFTSNDGLQTVHKSGTIDLTVVRCQTALQPLCNVRKLSNAWKTQ